MGLTSQFEGGEACGICGHVMTQLEKKQCETVMPTAIIPGFLYLGSYDTASRSEILKAMTITHILNVRLAASYAWGTAFDAACPCRPSRHAKRFTKTPSSTTQSAVPRHSFKSALISSVRPLQPSCILTNLM